MVVCAFAFAGTTLFGQFVDAGAVAAGLSKTIGPLGGTLFALFLIDAALIGAAAVTLSTSYAFSEHVLGGSGEGSRLCCPRV